jgi:DNA helicase TIP49 (TBP-interacting protein)
MSSPIHPKNLPRFLPTLTEVVHLPDAKVPPSAPTVNSDDLVDRIMLRLDGPLQAALQAAIGSLVIDKLREMEPRVRDEVDRAVRLCVEEAIAQEIAREAPN